MIALLAVLALAAADSGGAPVTSDYRFDPTMDGGTRDRGDGKVIHGGDPAHDEAAPVTSDYRFDPTMDGGARDGGDGKQVHGGDPTHGNSALVTLAAAGDVTLGYHFEEFFDLRLDGGSWADAGASPAASREQMLAYPFANVAPVLSRADIAVVNLECPFTSRGEKIAKNFNFRASPELSGALLPPGIDVVTIANNHLMDYGPDGVRDTIDALDKIGVAHFGAGMNLAEARTPAILERHGEKIAFLGYLYIGDPPIEPLVVWAGKDKPGVAGAGGDLDALEKMIAEDVKKAHREANVVVVFFHFGKEALHVIQPYQATLAHFAIDSGANLVLGSHPHVLQGAELYKGVPIVYSLGNFVFGGNADPKNKESAIFEATLAGRRVIKTDFVPVQITRVPDAPFQPFVLEGEAAKLIHAHLAEYSKAFPEPLVR